MKPRYLAKGSFKLRPEGLTKLFFTKNAAYADQGQNDPLTQALAKGGYQVGEMAKFLHKIGGIQLNNQYQGIWYN